MSNLTESNVPVECLWRKMLRKTGLEENSASGTYDVIVLDFDYILKQTGPRTAVTLDVCIEGKVECMLEPAPGWKVL